MNADTAESIAVHLVISGLVQGVGFRPFISRLALKLGLRGYIRNIGGSEVEVWIEGPWNQVEEFLVALYYEKPPPASIDSVYACFEKPRGYTFFAIEKSNYDYYTESMIPPDFAVCSDCLREVLDPSDRRYRYPFNSCAWCGPRFSMMYRVPYDRENTAMFKYKLCSRCLQEYENPENLRRYHAQGISCPEDGPRLVLYNRNFEVVECKDPIKEAAKLIEEGCIVGIKGIGGYHIATLATDDDVVLELRRRKKRPRKPFAVMGLNVDVLRKLVYITREDELVLESPQAPILLLPKKHDSPVSKYVSPGLSHEGVFIAYTPLHYLLLMETRDRFLVMTSGNVSGEPMCTDEECAKSKLSSVVDYFLVHNRDIVNRVDDSVIRKTGGKYVLLRRSRGYAPEWITIPRDLGGEYIAFGGDISSAGAIGFRNKVVLTQFVGDLDSFSAQRELLKYVDFLASTYRIGSRSKPIVVVDAHPRLYARRIGLEYARKKGYPLVEVQHHYAHVLGAAYDNEFSGEIAGVALDGVGWGLDGTIWGGEVLVFNTEVYGFNRVASLKQLPVTSDTDTLKPIRIAIAYYAKRGFELDEITRLLKLKDASNPSKMDLVAPYVLTRSGKYTPASSTGRLLDMVASILEPRIERSYEGEPAIWLEAQAWNGSLLELDNYKYVVENGVLRVDYDGMVDRVVELRGKQSTGDLARSFLYWLGRAIGELVVKTTRGTRVEAVVVSGGAAVNEFIYNGLSDTLAEEGFKPHLPRRIPPNDGGLAFGQIVAASLMFVTAQKDT
ncbi:MAG: carbamoyltransferase HypF [Desulfurococcaceae archaeon]